VKLRHKSGTQNGGRPAPWTSKELARLRAAAHLGAAGAAEALSRPPESVRQAAKRHRISLRQPGERRGLLLGQPRGVSLLEARDAASHATALRAVREEVLAGRLDPANLERAARRRYLLERGVPLCPGCARNPQENRASGLCVPCHLRHLADGHRSEGDEAQEAQRELWRERQRKVRARRRLEVEGGTPA
jgi:hypothetical protein